MEPNDNNLKDEHQLPSTSKKENRNRKDDGTFEDGQQRDDRSYTESTASDYSRSPADLRKENRANDVMKAPLGVGKGHKTNKKKNVRRGRVVKRRKSPAHGKRSYPVRRAAGRRKSRVMKRQRDGSVSTFFSRLSSRTASDTCTYCGHQCCRRRSWSIDSREGRRGYVRTIAQKIRKMRRQELRKCKKHRLGKRNSAKSRDSGGSDDSITSEAIQVGSNCKMLSPLFIKTNMNLGDEPANDDQNYIQVTPEMIFDALRKLALWRQSASFDTILNHLQANYPVNRNQEELKKELLAKLTVAELAGIATKVTRNEVMYWYISCDLMNRGLTDNHVTIFWKIYVDTLSPVTKGGVRHEPPKNDPTELEPRVNPMDSNRFRRRHPDAELKFRQPKRDPNKLKPRSHEVDSDRFRHKGSVSKSEESMNDPSKLDHDVDSNRFICQDIESKHQKPKKDSTVDPFVSVIDSEKSTCLQVVEINPQQKPEPGERDPEVSLMESILLRQRQVAEMEPQLTKPTEPESDEGTEIPQQTTPEIIENEQCVNVMGSSSQIQGPKESNYNLRREDIPLDWNNNPRAGHRNIREKQSDIITLYRRKIPKVRNVGTVRRNGVVKSHRNKRKMSKPLKRAARHPDYDYY